MHVFISAIVAIIASIGIYGLTTTIEPDLGVATPIAGQTYTLAGSGISSSATSFTLTSFTITQTGQLIQDTDMSDVFYLTFEPGSRSRQEIASCTTVTQNADGTATISGCQRGLLPITPYTASSTYAFPHSGGTAVIFSNPPQLYNQVGFLENDESITGTWQAPTPTGDNQIATKGYVDGIVTGGTVTNEAVTVAGTAGETFATGTIVFFDDIQDEWMPASAAVSASSTNVQLGIAQGAGSDGITINGGVLTRGLDRTNIGGIPGQTIYLSDTLGATSTSPGTVSVVLGQTRSASQLYFDPIYANLAGLTSSNTFSGTNTFTGEALEVGVIELNAGAAINGATLPVPVYASSTDGEVYAMDSGILSTQQNLVGFAVTNATDGNAIRIQTSGIVDGFSGLEVGQHYFVQSTAGTIATTTTTNTIPVGIAVSAIEIFIQKGTRRLAGDGDAIGITSGSQTVVTGFRPAVIRIKARAGQDATDSTGGTLDFTWTNGSVNAVTISGITTNSELIADNNVRLYDSGSPASNYMTFAISSVTDTGFTVTWTETGTFDNEAAFMWEAESY